MQTALTHKLENNEKVLRLGVVENGRIVEERIIRRQGSITVGRSARNTVMLASLDAPESLPLIDVHRGAHVLRFKKGDFGKVSCGGEVIDLRTAARRGLAQARNGEFRLPLKEQVSGKIKVGDSTMLFQFVNAPALVVAAPLPREARGSWVKSLDRSMLGFFLAVFLLLGGAGMGMESWWHHTGKYLQVTRKPSSESLRNMVPPWKITQKVKDPNVVTDDDRPSIDHRGVIVDPNGEKPDPETPTGTIINPPDAANNEGKGLETEVPEPVRETDKPVLTGTSTERVKEKIAEAFGPSPAKAPEQRESDPPKGRGSNDKSTVVTIVDSTFGIGPALPGKNSGSGRLGFKDAFGKKLDVGDDSVADERFTLADASEGAEAGSGGSSSRGIVVPSKDDNPIRDLDVGVLEGEAPLRPFTGGGIAGEMKPRPAGHTLRPPVHRPPPPTSSTTISQFVRGRQSALGRCYYTAVRRNPNVGNLLKIKVYVNKAGKARVMIVKDNTNDPTIARCVVDKIEQWNFTNNSGDRLVATIPLVFRKQ